MEYVPISDTIRSNFKVISVANSTKLDADLIAKCLIWLYIEAKKSYQDGIVTALDGDDIRLAAVFGFKKRSEIRQAHEIWEAFKTVRVMRDGELKNPIIVNKDGELYINDWMESGPGYYLAEREAKRKAARDKKRQQRGQPPTVSPALSPRQSSGQSPVPRARADELESESEYLTKTKNPPTPLDEILGLYNQTLAAGNPPECPAFPKENLTDDLRASIRARWRARPNLEWWEAYFKRVAASLYLTGKKKNWRASLPWLVGPKNMTKVLGGGYDDAPGPDDGQYRNAETVLYKPVPKPGECDADFEKRMAEYEAKGGANQ